MTLESPLDCKEIQPAHPKADQSWVVHWKDWCWSRNSNTLATQCKELTHLKRPWCWERLRAGGEGTTEDEMVGWHHRLNGHGFGWTLGVGWQTGRPGVLQFMGSQRVRHDWATELNWTGNRKINYFYTITNQSLEVNKDKFLKPRMVTHLHALEGWQRWSHSWGRKEDEDSRHSYRWDFVACDREFGALPGMDLESSSAWNTGKRHHFFRLHFLKTGED